MVSSIGAGKKAFWESLSQGKSGVSLISSFDTSAFTTKFAGEIKDFDPAYFATVAANLKDGGAILTWGNFFVNNLIPATIGNIIGGALMVGGMYWFIYLRASWTGKPTLNSPQK